MLLVDLIHTAVDVGGMVGEFITVAHSKLKVRQSETKNRLVTLIDKVVSLQSPLMTFHFAEPLKLRVHERMDSIG